MNRLGGSILLKATNIDLPVVDLVSAPVSPVSEPVGISVIPVVISDCQGGKTAAMADSFGDDSFDDRRANAGDDDFGDDSFDDEAFGGDGEDPMAKVGSITFVYRCCA